MNQTEPVLVNMPRDVAHQYEHLGMAIQAFAKVFRPDNGKCFENMAQQVRELAKPELTLYQALEHFHAVVSAGSIGLERVISWHRQLPERGVPWLPYRVEAEEARLLGLIADELEKLDQAVKTSAWNGPGGGMRFTQAVGHLRSLEMEADLFAFNAGISSLLHQFQLLAMYRP